MGTKTSEPCREPPRRRASRRAFRRTLPGRPAGPASADGLVRSDIVPQLSGAQRLMHRCRWHPGDASRPSAYIPGDARSVGSFQAVKWLSRHILARKRAAVFHGPLDSLPSANTTRWNHMIRFQCVGIGGLGAKPSSLCSSARPSGAVRLEPAQPCQAQSASIKTVFLRCSTRSPRRLRSPRGGLVLPPPGACSSSARRMPQRA